MSRKTANVNISVSESTLEEGVVLSFQSNNFVLSLLANNYIDVESVISLIRNISERGKHRLYNVASGYNISHQKIIFLLKDLTGCSVTVEKGAAALKWPIVNIDRIVQEFDFLFVHAMAYLQAPVNPQLVLIFQLD